jgi:hypothetical protein
VRSLNGTFKALVEELHLLNQRKVDGAARPNSATKTVAAGFAILAEVSN